MLVLDGETNIGYVRFSPDCLHNVEQRRKILDEYEDVSIVVTERHLDSEQPILKELLNILPEGSAIYVTSLDRIALSTIKLLSFLESLTERKISLVIQDLNLGTRYSGNELHPGRRFLVDLRSIVDFEQKVKSERRRIGIEKGKREGMYKGRKATAMKKAPEVLALKKAGGLTNVQIADRVGISQSSVYRILRLEKDGLSLSR
jgi:DNA invertase Pin-like site-specific DNA recombinase